MASPRPTPTRSGAPRSLERLGAAFGVEGRCTRVVRLEGGHIHDTYLAEYDAPGRPVRLVHQRLNDRVFSDPETVARNTAAVTAHLNRRVRDRRESDQRRRTLTQLRARDGRPFHRDEQGCWRTYLYVERTHVPDRVADVDRAHALAATFGCFLRDVHELRGRLAVTIPAFHDPVRRREELEAARAADPCGRAAAARPVADALARLGDRLREESARRGFDDLPSRVVHHDAKVANVLVDDRTGEPLCVIDLDTVMEGRVTSDFGELVRTSVGVAEDDEPHRLRVDRDLYRAVAHGFLRGAGGVLVEAEVRALGAAGPLLAWMNAARFLTDHLEGDRYFRVARPDQNLARARTQLVLAEQLVAVLDELDALVEEAATTLREGVRSC